MGTKTKTGAQARSAAAKTSAAAAKKRTGTAQPKKPSLTELYTSRAARTITRK